MIWHIFKKDWKLIWVFVAVVAASQAITELVLAKARVSDDSPMLTLLAQNLPTGMIFFMMFLIAAIVSSMPFLGCVRTGSFAPSRAEICCLKSCYSR